MRVPESLSASTSREPQHAVPPKVSLCVILAGGIKAHPLASASSKSILDLYVSPTKTVLEMWADHIRSAWSQTESPEIVVLHSGSGAEPHPAPELNVEVRHDATDFRGPAGAVRDAAIDVDSSSYVLVIEGASFLRRPLTQLFCGSGESAAAVIGVNSDGSPAGLYLVRRDLLDIVPPIGFMDLKEQFLSQARDAGHRIVVRDMGDSALKRLRSRQDLLVASTRNGTRNNGSEQRIPVITRGGSGGSCLCDDSNVADDALVFDSIVMPGSTVGSNAVVVRSILFEGARVEPGEIILDQMISVHGRTKANGHKTNGVHAR